MMRRSDHLTFVQKLRAEKARTEAALQEVNSSPQRKSLERKLSQLETAFRWLNSWKLQPSK